MAAKLILALVIKKTLIDVFTLIRSPVIDLPIGEEGVDKGVGAVLPTHV